MNTINKLLKRSYPATGSSDLVWSFKEYTKNKLFPIKLECLECGRIINVGRDTIKYNRLKPCKTCIDLSKIIDKKINDWTVLRFGGRDKWGCVLLVCKCKCGTIKTINKSHLTSGQTKMCMSCSHKATGKKLRHDLVGKIYGRLKVIAPAGSTEKGNSLWKCICSCKDKTEVTAVGTELVRGRTTSCGCLKTELNIKRATTHGMTYTSEYSTWKHMKDRCLNVNCDAYKYYGGRGITVCDSWLESFENFYKDMGDKPEGMSIDRINNDGNYEPDNCKWSTRLEQNNNRRCVKIV